MYLSDDFDNENNTEVLLTTEFAEQEMYLTEYPTAFGSYHPGINGYYSDILIYNTDTQLSKVERKVIAAAQVKKWHNWAKT